MCCEKRVDVGRDRSPIRKRVDVGSDRSLAFIFWGRQAIKKLHKAKFSYSQDLAVHRALRDAVQEQIRYTAAWHAGEACPSDVAIALEDCGYLQRELTPDTFEPSDTSRT